MRRRLALSLALFAAVGAAIAFWISRQRPAPSSDLAADAAAQGETAVPHAAGLQGAKPPVAMPGDASDPNSAGGRVKDAAPPAAGTQAGVRRVRVLASASRLPIEGALVRARHGDDALAKAIDAKTNAEGVAILEGIGGDQRVKFVLTVFARGFRPKTSDGSGELDADRFLVETVELEPGIPFDGRVIDAIGGAPIVGASVVVSDRGDFFEIGPTDEQGRFHVPGAKDDSDSRVWVRARGYAPAVEDVRVDGGKPQPAELTVRLVRGGALMGTVVSAEGKAVAGAAVRIAPQQDPVQEPSQETDKASPADRMESYEYDDDILERTDGIDVLNATAGPDGAYRAEGLKFDVTYEVAAHAHGHAGSIPVRDVQVSASAPERRVALTLRREAIVLLRVVAPEGSSLPSEARVRLFQDEIPIRPDGRDGDGRYRFGSVDPGPTDAFVQAEGFRSAVNRVVAREGVQTQIEIVLEEGATVEGVVVDASGKPLARAEVEVAPTKHNEADSGDYLSHRKKARTDSEGRFSLAGVPPGPVVLMAKWRDYKPNGETLGTRKWLRFDAPARAVRVVLSRKGRVRMRLLTPAGEPFSGEATSELISEERGGGGGGGTHIEKGIVEEDGIEDGTYRFVVIPPGFAWIRRSVKIVEGGLVDLGDVVLDPGVVVSGRVMDGAGHPVQNASIKCDAFEFDERAARTDAEGRFSLDRFPHEPFTLTVNGEGYSPATILVEPATVMGLEVRLGKPATVRGAVKTAAGAVPEAVVIELRRSGATPRHETVVQPDGSRKEWTYYEGSEWPDVHEDGRFECSVAPGRWIGIWKDTDNKDHQVGEWTFTDGETRVLEIVLPGR